jgi:hypothetical protein
MDAQPWIFPKSPGWRSQHPRRGDGEGGDIDEYADGFRIRDHEWYRQRDELGIAFLIK